MASSVEGPTGRPGLEFGDVRRPRHRTLLVALLYKQFFLAWRRKRWVSVLLSNGISVGLLAFSTKHLSNSSDTYVINIVLASCLLPMALASHMQLALVDIVAEKESKMKVVQEINGLPTTAYWLSWLVYFMSYGLFGSVVILAATRFFTPMFARSSLSLLLLLWLLSFAQAFAAVCCVSVVCSRMFLASLLGNLLNGVCTLPPVVYVGLSVRLEIAPPWYVTYGMLALPVAGLTSAIASVAWSEGIRGVPLTVATLLTSPRRNGLLPVGVCMLAILVSIGAYRALAWWLDQVWQGEFGAAKPLCFCCFRRRRRVNPEYASTPYAGAPGSRGGQAAYAELSTPLCPAAEVRNQRQLAISVSGLVKLFNGKAAVDNLTLDILPGEIFAVLGHNGAGKTTLLNCLVGLMRPNAGSAHVAGFSVTEQIDEVRLRLALCPQDNPFYPEFTVDRHLRFFAALRDVEIQEERMPATLEAVGLLEKRFSETSTLSGGQKRRLWVATALIADAPVTVLDEPTSGMDPFARRELWQVLQQRRSAGRCVVFTTHYLDEADILADRKAILTKGRVQVVGTSRELKQRFGVGYLLQVELSACAAIAALHEVVSRHTAAIAEDAAPVDPFPPPAFAASTPSTLLKIRLPVGDIDVFGPLLEELEARRAELGLLHYGLQMTSLEDVFMRLCHEAEAEDGESRQSRLPSLEMSASPPCPQQPSSDFSGVSARARPLSDPACSAADVGTGAADAAAMPQATETCVRSIWTLAFALIHVRLRCLASSSSNLFQQVLLPSLVAGLIAWSATSQAQVLSYMTLIISPVVTSFANVVFKDVENKCWFVSVSQGLPKRAYWLGTLVADYLTISVALVTLLVALWSRTPPLWPRAVYPLLVLECVIFPLVLAPCAYAATTFFSTREGLMKFFPLALLFGCGAPTMGIYFGLLGLGNANTSTAAYSWQMAHIAMSLFNPMYGLPGVMAYTAARPQPTAGAFFTSGAVWPVLLSPLCAVFLWLWLFRHWQRSRRVCFTRNTATSPAVGGSGDARVCDPDVLAEEDRVRNLCRSASSQPAGRPAVNGDAIACLDLKHTYPATSRQGAPVEAVRGVSFGTQVGECFGLLGPNGAGKTTTLAMLSGESWPASGGDVFIGGRRICDELGSGCRFEDLLFGCFGLCPQTDPLWEDLSGRRHLAFYARVKGVLERSLDREVDLVLGALGLTGADAHKKSKEYSGGMKRKLSLGIALIGRPSTLLLDEPSAAVDAAAKRQLWSLIRNRRPTQSVLMTTHSMEEAEALCDRLAIQVLGRLRCLGSPVHLRSGFGHRLECVLREPENAEAEARAVDALCAFAREGLSPQATLLEQHRGRCLLQLPPVLGGSGGGAASLGAVVAEVSRARERLGIMEYSLWQPSLEQVFLRAGQEQEERSATSPAAAADSTVDNHPPQPLATE